MNDKEVARNLGFVNALWRHVVTGEISKGWWCPLFDRYFIAIEYREFTHTINRKLYPYSGEFKMRSPVELWDFLCEVDE